jgi:adenylate kinase
MKEKTCDSCNGNLYQREDDEIEVVKNRLKVYEESTEPVLRHYDKDNKLQSIDASKSIELVRVELTSLIQEMDS